MSIIYEAKDSYRLAGRAVVVDASRELAWAEKHVYQDRDLKWVLGNFVQSDTANDNGHIFPLEDLKVTASSLVNKPLNMVHNPVHIVGHYVAQEMLFPIDAAAESQINSPYVEALAAFYKYYFPDEYEVVQKAHAEGSLFFSMESVPKALTCATDGCNETFDYKGRMDDSYCAHLQQPQAKRRLVEPHFTGGALIVPPIRPGWRSADIKELSQLMATAEAEEVYEAVKEEAPHLDSSKWEEIMASILVARDFPEAERKKLAKTGAARPDGSFPIKNAEDLKNAIKLAGQAKDPGAARTHIKRRAKALGLENLIPEGW